MSEQPSWMEQAEQRAKDLTGAEPPAAMKDYQWEIAPGIIISVAYGKNEWVDAEELNDQLGVMVAALQIYIERELKYRGLWKELGWKDSVHHIISKAFRIKRTMWENEDVDLDSLVDLINYCAFAMRNIKAGNMNGAS